jgi:DHA2 family multidrug resistance protein
MFGVSYYMRAGYTTDASFWALTVPLLVQGVSMASFFLAMITISLDGIPPEKLPSATGIQNFALITAGSFAASLVTTWWDRREALHQSRLVEGLNAYSPAYRGAVDAMAARGMSETQAAAILGREVVNQSYLLASTEIFWISAIIMFAVIGLVWTTRRPAPPSGPVAAD